MGRRNESPEKKKRRALIAELLKDTPIKDGEDVNALMRELLSEVLENGLQGELDDELGYTRYDYRNKNTDNSRNGYFDKTVHTLATET
jgi:putative transposase